MVNKTKLFIEEEVRNYYYKAIDCGATVSSVEMVAPHIYKIKVCNMTLQYIGTVNGTAILVGVSGDIFE